MANKHTFKMILAEILRVARVKIAELVNEQISNAEKKAMLDEAVKGCIMSLLATVKLGWVTKFILERFVVQNIPVFTQAIYDLIKCYIDGVTNSDNSKK